MVAKYLEEYLVVRRPLLLLSLCALLPLPEINHPVCMHGPAWKSRSTHMCLHGCARDPQPHGRGWFLWLTLLCLRPPCPTAFVPPAPLQVRFCEELVGHVDQARHRARELKGRITLSRNNSSTAGMATMDRCAVPGREPSHPPPPPPYPHPHPHPPSSPPPSPSPSPSPPSPHL
jgi:hypothetical protein